MAPVIRVLGLGNDLLADDAFGVEMARELARRLPPDIETRWSVASGIALLDEMLEADALIVIDTIATGQVPAGTVHRFAEEQVEVTGQAASGHYMGLFETLRLGRQLQFRVPERVVIVAVEAEDTTTVGGGMSAAVRAAKPIVKRLVEDQIAEWCGSTDL